MSTLLIIVRAILLALEEEQGKKEEKEEEEELCICDRFFFSFNNWSSISLSIFAMMEEGEKGIEIEEDRDRSRRIKEER